MAADDATGTLPAGDAFEFSFDPSEGEAGASFDSSGADKSQQASDPNTSEPAEKPALAQSDGATSVDQRPAEERIEELFRRMAPHRLILKGILEFCAQPRDMEELKAQTADMHRRHHGVFSTENFVTLLQEAGALERTAKDGSPYEDKEPEPRTVVVDGVEYLEPGEPPVVYWSTSEEARGWLGQDDPVAQLAELFSSEAMYLPIYKRILKLCSAEGGVMMPALGAAVDSDVLVQSPRFYAARFVDALEKTDAVLWDDGWHTTAVGLEGLEMLRDVEDASEGDN